jgi:WD40 repeat protein
MAVLSASPAWADGASDLFQDQCSACHGTDRLGGTGPALLPESLKRLKQERALSVITDGRTATQMPAFGKDLSPSDIESLVALIYTPLDKPPRWNAPDIVASRIVHRDTEPEDTAPIWDADPLNLFVVVESGDHHVTILDGDTFESIERFASRFALHGGPKFSPDGRYVYFGSRDGWVSKYDLYRLELVAEVRAGINTRNIAISHDGRVLAVANYLPHTLVMLDAATLELLRIIPVSGAIDKRSSRVSAVYQAAPRDSFVVALKDVPEMWEVSYAEDPPPVYGDFVHSYEKGMEEGIVADANLFPVRRVPLSQPLEDFFFDPTYRLVMGSARANAQGVVVHLDVRMEIADVPLPGMPHLGSGITWMRNGTRVMATPHLGEARVSVIDIESWSLVDSIETLGPGFFMRSHENSPYVWADVFFGPNKDAMHVIDKQSLKIIRTLIPEPGKTAAHVEFTRDGRYALVSIWDMDGAIVVYDAETLEEVKRIPFVKPAGKYNIYNKITRSEGTSH